MAPGRAAQPAPPKLKSSRPAVAGGRLSFAKTDCNQALGGFETGPSDPLGAILAVCAREISEMHSAAAQVYGRSACWGQPLPGRLDHK